MSKERPRVLVNPPPEDVFVNPENLIWLRPIEVVVYNEGFTQALNVSIHGTCTATMSDAPPEWVELSELTIPNIVKANSEPFLVPTRMSDGLEVMTEKPEMFFIHVFGIVKYEDFLGRQFATRFRYRIQMMSVNDNRDAASILGWQRCGNPEDNYAS